MTFRRTAALLATLSVVFCAPLFANLDNWGREDWDQFSFRYETPRVALLRDHVLPTWNPYANGGTALLAHPDSPVMSPWYAIVLVLGSALGLRVQVLLFMAIGAIGMAALARRLGAGTAGGIVAGVAFMMSSHFALHIAEGHLEWCVLGLMPWLALCVLRLREGARFIIGAALLLASVLMFGAVYIPAVFLPFFSAWVLFESIRVRQWRTLTRWGAVVVIALLLSSIKLLPTVEFSRAWPRPAEAELHNTPPKLLLTALFDPRQALLYQARRDRELPTGHFAKVVPSEIGVPLIRSLDAMQMRAGFHEYGTYLGIAGILLAVCGIAASMRRLWPVYAAGAIAIVVALGESSPVDLWLAMRQLPLYDGLQVPSRFLAAAVFALAIAAGLGMTALGNLVARRTPWRRTAEVVLVVALCAELTALGWRLFRDVFVVPPIALKTHADFAHRFVDMSLVPMVMTSTTFSHLATNSGTLDGYENLTVARGAVLTPRDTAYRGEAYLAESRGTADITRWTMSRITVRVSITAPDNLVINQNFDAGWRARVTGGEPTGSITARRTAGGLISVPVTPAYHDIELFYVPRGLAAGAWISGATLLLCLFGMWHSRSGPLPRSQDARD